jgi:hypothetical protein
MGEQDEPTWTFRDGQAPGQPYRPGLHIDLLIPRQDRAHAGGLPGQSGGLAKAVDDLLVGGLGEVGVPLPDRHERRRRLQADQLIGIASQPLGPVRRGHRDREHHTRRSMGACDLAGRPCRGPGGDPVIDHDHRSPSQRYPDPAPAEALGAALQLGTFARLDGGELVGGDMRHAHDLLVDDAHVILTDRAHSQLRLERHAQLAHHDDIQRRAKRPCHLERHRNTAARKAEHDRVLAPQIPQAGAQQPSRIHAINEHQ